VFEIRGADFWFWVEQTPHPSRPFPGGASDLKHFTCPHMCYPNSAFGYDVGKISAGCLVSLISWTEEKSDPSARNRVRTKANFVLLGPGISF